MQGRLDLAMALSGWAPHRGGPLTYACQQGIQKTIDAFSALAEPLGRALSALSGFDIAGERIGKELRIAEKITSVPIQLQDL